MSLISNEDYDDINVDPPYRPQSESDSSAIRNLLGKESEDGQPRKKVRKVTHWKRAKAKVLRNTGAEYVDKGGKLHE